MDEQQDKEDDLAMSDYLRSQRMTPEERAAFRAKYDLDKVYHPLDFPAEDVYDAHSQHTEYGAANH